MRGLRNILSSRIVLSRASRGAVVHQCGIEPGTVPGKTTEQLGRFGAFELAHGRQQLGRPQRLTQAPTKSSLKQRLDMLNAPLASGRCFGWFNFHGHVPSDRKPLPARLIQQREVNRSREGIVNLNEVHPALLEIAYYQARLLSIVDREVIGRIVFRTVQDGSRQEDGRAKQFAAAYAFPPGVDFLQVAAHAGSRTIERCTCMSQRPGIMYRPLVFTTCKSRPRPMMARRLMARMRPFVTTTTELRVTAPFATATTFTLVNTTTRGGLPGCGSCCAPA